jgi:hypothetical protein
MKQIFFFALIIVLMGFFFASCKNQVKDNESPVTFRIVEIKEKHHLKNDVQNPVLSIELKIQYPTAFSDDSVLNKIRSYILADFFPDRSEAITQPESALKTYIDSKIKLYESSEDVISDEDVEPVSQKPDIAWWDNTSMLIRHNGNGVLSYTIESNQFTGGAHGGTTFRNTALDLRNGEKIREEDLFTEESLPLINEIILKKLEIENKVESSEELAQIGYFDVTEIGQYKNFYLTNDGIVYTFNEYEIGAYALGTIEVKLLYKDIAGYVKPDSPLEKIIRK